MQTTVRRGVLSFLFIISLAAVVFVHADRDRSNDDPNSNDDKIVREDRTDWQKGNFEKRFGMRFERHVRVCNDAADGDVNCDVRVVTDAAGNPKVTQKTLPFGLSPQKLQTAYGLTNTASSAKRVIAIVDAYHDPNIYSD